MIIDTFNGGKDSKAKFDIDNQGFVTPSPTLLGIGNRNSFHFCHANHVIPCFEDMGEAYKTMSYMPEIVDQRVLNIRINELYIYDNRTYHRFVKNNIRMRNIYNDLSSVISYESGVDYIGRQPSMVEELKYLMNIQDNGAENSVLYTRDQPVHDCREDRKVLKHKITSILSELSEHYNDLEEVLLNISIEKSDNYLEMYNEHLSENQVELRNMYQSLVNYETNRDEAIRQAHDEIYDINSRYGHIVF